MVVSKTEVEEQQGDPHSKPEILKLKTRQSFSDSVILDGSAASKSKREKLELLCKQLKDARMKGFFVDLQGKDNALDKVEIIKK